MGEVVGRDQLSDALMNNLRDRRARRPHAIVGGVGVGKTAVLVHLTDRLAAKGAVPIPIRLRDVQTDDQLDFCELARKRFTEIVSPIVRSDAELDRTWRWLRQRADRIVVLADGLEEALTHEELAGERDNVFRSAIRTANSDGLPLVIASRPHDPLRAMQAAVTELEPLSDEAALAYISRGGSWRSDPMLLDRVVEAAKMVEAPLYLQIARDLHRKDLLEPLWAEAGSDEPMLHDRWAFREDLLRTWMDALVEGKLHPELPIGQDIREAVLVFISALACIGLAKDSATVALGELDPSFGTYHQGKPQETQQDSLKAEWNDRVAQYLGERMLELRTTLAPTAASDTMSWAGWDTFWMDLRLAATWGTRMGLVQESAQFATGGQGSRGEGDSGGRVHFQHSIIQAYLGSRFLPNILKQQSRSAESARAACDEPTNGFVHSILLSGGRELLIALILQSRSLDGRCTCRAGSTGPREPCPVRFVRKQLTTAASSLLQEADVRTSRLYRIPASGSESDRLRLAGRHSLRRRALEFLGSAIEVESVEADPQLEELIEAAKGHWPQFGLGEDEVRVREAKLVALEHCAAAARRAATGKYPEQSKRAYLKLLEIACTEPDHRVRTAVARQIGVGGEQAYRGFSDWTKKKVEKPADGATNPKDDRDDPRRSHHGEAPSSDACWGPREHHAWQRQQQKEQARSERSLVGREVDAGNKRWFRDVMKAWLLPMLVESSYMIGHKGSPWDDLEKWIDEAATAGVPRRGGEGGNQTPPPDGEKCGRGLVLAQGFKFAANRRPTIQSNQKAREFLIKKAEELLKRSEFWYTRLTLLQALTLWALPDDVNEAQSIRGHGADPKGKVDEWLRTGQGQEKHPLVKEAGRLAVRALQTRRPERFLWIDDVNVVSQIGTEASAPGEPRLHNLWIPPSSGWSSLDFKAQQLLADVLLLMVLGERDSRPNDLFRLLERVIRERPTLPSCMSRDRTRLDPVRAVESDVQPGDYCRDDCELRMCPYPVKAKSLRVEFNELFCLRQREMLTTWRPRSWVYLCFRREAPWQRQVPVAGMRRFWDQMGERARDVHPNAPAARPGSTG